MCCVLQERKVTIMPNSFLIEEANGDDWMVSMVCQTVEEASRVKSDLQSICGSRFEQDGELIYAIISDGCEDDAEKKLKQQGFVVEIRV